MYGSTYLLSQDLREDISSFRANMPVIRALCQEAFERHRVV